MLIAQKMFLKYIIAVSTEKLSFAGAIVIKKGNELKCRRANISFIASNNIFQCKIQKLLQSLLLCFILQLEQFKLERRTHKRTLTAIVFISFPVR